MASNGCSSSKKGELAIELPQRSTSKSPVHPPKLSAKPKLKESKELSPLPPLPSCSESKSPPRLPPKRTDDEEVEAIIQSIHRAAQDGDKFELESLIRNKVNPNARDSLGRTPLHHAVSIECRCTPCVQNAEACTRLLLSAPLIEVNAQDDKGNSPLHLAIHHQLTKCAELLISAGADVCLKSFSGDEPAYLLVKKLPDTMIYLLDESIFVDQHDPKDDNCVLKVDFSPLVGNPKFKTTEGRTSTLDFSTGRDELRISWQREMRLMLAILQNPATAAWRAKILTHPVVQIFMEQEWKRARKYFLCSIVLYLIYVLLLTAYIVIVYLQHCPSSVFAPVENITHANISTWLLSHAVAVSEKPVPVLEITDAPIDHRRTHPESFQCQAVTGVRPGVVILLALTAILALTEFCRLMITPRMYIRSFVNLGTWVFIAFVLWSTVPNLKRRQIIDASQYQAAAFTVFSAWVFTLHQVGRFPSLGKYIEMFGVVLRSFGFFVITFLSMFIAFGLSFAILFPTRAAFNTLQTSILKTFVMMTGEVDYNTLFYGSSETIKASLLVHLLFAAFVFIVTIVLMNFLIGLTVQDIQKLQTHGELRRMHRLILELHRLESFIFSKRIPRRLGDKLKASISVLQPTKQGRREGLIFEFRPNSEEDRSVPKHLKRQALQLASISYEKYRAGHCSKIVHSSEGSINGQSSNYPPLLRRLNRQHYKLIAVKSSIYKGHKLRY